MHYIPEGSEIILWGTGNFGRMVMEGKFGKYKISFAVNGKLDANETYKIGDISVYSPSVLEDASFCRNQIIVIGIYRWEEFALILEKMGKHIFRDYIPYTYLEYVALDFTAFYFCNDDEERNEQLKKLSSGKKICGLYGFCHMPVYASLLWKSKQFSEEYCMIRLHSPRPLSLENDILLLCTSWIYSLLDLLILGFVYPSKIFGTPDWRMVKRQVNDSCKVILVSSATFKGYFPQHTTPFPEVLPKIRWGDKNLNKMILEGKTADDIFQTISAPDFYDAEKVNRYYENELNKLERNESQCDVRIADYIRKYGKDRRLMYSPLHPCSCLMKEMGIRLFKKLGLDTETLEKMPESEILSLMVTGEFIYPSVYYALGMTEAWENEKICVSGDMDVCLTFSEYVDHYVEVNAPYIKGDI